MMHYFKILLNGMLISFFVFFPLKLSESQNLIYQVRNPLGYNDHISELNLETGQEKIVYTVQSQHSIAKGVGGLVSDLWHNRGFFYGFYTPQKVIDYNTGEVTDLFDFPNGGHRMAVSSDPCVSPGGKYILISSSHSQIPEKSCLYCIDGNSLEILSSYCDWSLDESRGQSFFFDSQSQFFYHRKGSKVFSFRLPELLLVDSLVSNEFGTGLPEGYKKKGYFRDIKSGKGVLFHYNKSGVNHLAKLVDIKKHSDVSSFFALPELDESKSSFDHKIFLSPDAQYLFVYYNEALYQHDVITGKLLSQLETPNVNAPEYIFQDDRLYQFGDKINKINWRNNTIISSVPIQEAK